MDPVSPAPVTDNPPAPTASPSPQIPPVTPATPPPPPPMKSRKKLIILIVVTLILIITLISVAAIYLNLTRPQTTPSPTPEVSIESPIPDPTMMPISTPQSTTSSATPAPNSQVLTIQPRVGMDGYFSSNGTGSTTGDIRAGRNTYAITRSFMSFDLANLPKNAVIQSAVLRMYQSTAAGDPYTAIGALVIDHMDFGPSLEAEDYNLPALQSKFAILTSNAQVEWKEVVVTEQVRFDQSSNRLQSQFRLLFDKERIGGTSGGDFAYFESSENFGGSGNAPQLVITYNLQ